MTLLVVPMLVVGGLWLSQQYWLPSLVRPELERQTGMRFDAASMQIGFDGRVRLVRASLRSRSDRATLNAPLAYVDVNWRKALRGGLDARAIIMRKPVLRIDSSIASSLVDAEGEAPDLDWLGSIPELTVTDAVIQFTDSSGPSREVVVSMRGDGSLTRRAGDRSVIDLRFEQSGAADPVEFTGWINTRDGAANIHTGNVALTNWIAAFTIPHGGDFWRSILTEGRLVAADIEISPRGGVSSRLDVEGVRLALPTPQTSAMADERLVLEDVNGRVFLNGASLRANLAGLIDGLPTAATFATDGLSLTSPFRCDLVGGPFMVSQHWKPMQLAPEFVRRVLHDFSGPSAEVSASIVLSRLNPAASPSEGIAIAGEAHVEHGAATFLEFPYPMREVAGTVRFDDEMIRLIGLTGVGLTGAALRGEGTVTPVPGSAVLDLTIWGEQAPIDSVLLSALDEQEREIVASLFSERVAAELASAGAFASSAEKAEAASTIERLEDALEAALDAGDIAKAESLRASIADAGKVLERPTFDVGGLVSVRARVQWDGRRKQRHEIDVDVHFDRAGLLYEHFPYPVVVAPLDAKIDLSGVTITQAPLAGLAGAAGAIRGDVSWDRDSVQPNLEIEFSSLPVDEPLLKAVAMATQATNAVKASGPRREKATMSVSDALMRFGASGVVHGDADVSFDETGVTWNVDVPLHGLTLRTSGDANTPAAVVDSFDGVLNVSPDGWRIPNASARFASNPITFSIDAPSDGDPTILFASESFDLKTPFEGYLRELDADAAARVARVRNEIAVDGRVSVAGSAVMTAHGPEYDVEVAGAGELTFDVAGRAVRAAPRAGAVTLRNERIDFDELDIQLLNPLGGSSGDIRLNGAWSDGDASRIEIAAANVAIESPLVQRVLTAFRPDVAPWIESARPSGRFDASATIVSEPGLPVAVTEGLLEPKSFHFTAGIDRVEIDTISGALTVGSSGGRIKQLELRSSNWSAHLDGEWFAGGAPGIDVRVNARGESLRDDIVALLPRDVQDVFRVLDIRVERGFALHNGELAINAPIRGQDLGDGFRDGVFFTGAVTCAGAAIDTGVQFSDIDGDIAITASRSPFAPATQIDVSLHLDHAKAAGLTLKDVNASIRSANDAWDVIEIDVLGESHGGRIWGQGAIRSNESSEDSAGYRFDLRMAGLDLAAAMHEYTGAAPSAAPDVGHRGHVDASLVLSGDLSADAKPRGAGELRILGGELARLPLVFSVLELGNLIPPIGEKLDYARADFALANGVATFDRLLIVSPSLALVGEGDVTLPEFELDLRFGASGNYRLPVLSALFDVVRNEILTTRVRGALGRPEFSIEQLSATRRLFSRIFGGQDSGDGGGRSVAEVADPPN